MRSNTSRTGCFITIVAHNRAYFYIDRGHSWFLTGETKLLRTPDATHCRVTATLDPWHERQAFFWPVLAIFWPTFLRFRTWVIRHRYWYWWHMNETRSAFVELDVTHHFVMGYRTFMSSSLKLHCFISSKKQFELIILYATGQFWLNIFVWPLPCFSYNKYIFL